MIPADLGRTLPHEHVFCDFYRVTGVLDHLLNDEALALDELAALAKAGGRALVEVSTPDLGRDPAALRRVSERSGLHVVMGTGWYRQPYYPPEIDRTPVEALAARMIGELVDGVDGTGIRAGIIGEIGAHLGYLTAQEERVLRAAARAQRATGAPLSTHASMYPVGLAQPAAPPRGGRRSRPRDRRPLRHLSGRRLPPGDPRRRRLGPVRHDRPHPHQPGWAPGRRGRGAAPRGLGRAPAPVQRPVLPLDLRAFGGAGYDVVFTRFFDLLRERGVSDDELDLMTITNPQRVLAW